jgi:hypothetical protein
LAVVVKSDCVLCTVNQLALLQLQSIDMNLNDLAIEQLIADLVVDDIDIRIDARCSTG